MRPPAAPARRASRPEMLAAAVVAALAAAACGSGGGSSSGGTPEADRPPAQILRDAADALRSAHTLRLRGGGQPGGFTFDVAIGGRTSFEGQFTDATGTVNVVSVGGRSYVSGRSLFARMAGPGAAEIIGDRCVLLPAGTENQQLIQGFASLADTSTLADTIVRNSRPPLTKGTRTRVDGVEVIPVVDSTGAILAVASTGKPYPVRAAKPSGPDAGSVIFSDYDKRFSIRPPRDCIDLSLVEGSPAAPPTRSRPG